MKIPILLIFSFVLLISCNKEEKTATQNETGLFTENNSFITTEGISIKDSELEITLFASEPMIANPTNMDIDQKGRVWMCQAYNYRNDFNKIPYEKKGDKILILEDTDNDGKADKSKVYYQGEDVNSALGICVTGNKVIVSCSPNVLVFTDTNGDDVPDKKEILFKTVGGLQSDHGLHAFVFGPDGKLYFNFGNFVKGLTTADGKPMNDIYNTPISDDSKPLREGMVLRIDPDGKNPEVLGWNFRNNYELALDSFGRIWQSDNDDDGNRGNRINFIVDYGNYGYKDEMTGADWRVKRTNMEDSVFLQHWHLNDPGVIPNLRQTYAGSPTGMLVYEGDLLPPKYKGELILCDAGTNLVSAYPSIQDGAGFKVSKLPIADASGKDQWFRPSDVTVAPDGSLFVADWYDGGVGGHGIGDLKKGRIYRIAPKGSKFSKPVFDYKSIKGAIEALKNPNLDVRYLAFQALQGFGVKAETSLLELYEKGEPAYRARALWLLSKIKNRETHYIQKAGQDAYEDIRMVAVKIARQSRKFDKAFYLKMSKDKSFEVKREVALAIRHQNQPEIWASLAESYVSGDRWYLEALGIGADQDWDNCLKAYQELKGERWLETDAAKDIVWRSRATSTPQLLAEIIGKSGFASKARYYRAFDFQENKSKNDVLISLLKKTDNAQEKVIIFRHFDKNTITRNAEFNKILPQVIKSIENPYDFLDIISRYEIKSESARLRKLLMESQDDNLTLEAAVVTVGLYGIVPLKEAVTDPGRNKKEVVKLIERIGMVDNENINRQLALIFTSEKYPMSYRKAALLAMRGWVGEVTLWDLYKVNKIPAEFKEDVRKMLTMSFRSNIRTETVKMFGNKQVEEVKGDQHLLAQKTGDAGSGKTIFETYCKGCHMVNKQGVDFGPGLSQIGKKLTKEGLVTAILKPSQGVSFGYEGSIITLTDGSQVQGIITSKTATEYMVKYVGQSDIKILKKGEVKSVEPMKDSLMPDFGLKDQEVIDLVEYLHLLK